MKKYSERPAVVDATEWTGDNLDEIQEMDPTAAIENGVLYVTVSAGYRAGMEVGMWVVVDAGGAVTVESEAFLEYWQAEVRLNPMIARYQPRQPAPVEAVMWNGSNFAAVQTVCPQASRPNPKSSWFTILDASDSPIEVYVGEVVFRDLINGTFSKMSAELFNKLYETQMI